MSCVVPDPLTQTVIDYLALASRCGLVAIAEGVAAPRDRVSEVLDDLMAKGWIFGGPDRWALTGVGYAHASTQRRNGMLGDGLN